MINFFSKNKEIFLLLSIFLLFQFTNNIKTDIYIHRKKEDKIRDKKINKINKLLKKYKNNKGMIKKIINRYKNNI